MDYRKLYDKSFLGAWDLQDEAGRPLAATVEITKVEAGQLQSPGQVKKRRAPVLSFAGRSKRMVVNATNGATIARMYGVQTENWVGKRVTLYATTTRFGRDEVACIRVKPEIPPQRARPTPEQAQPPVEVVAELTARQAPAELDTETPQDPPGWDQEYREPFSVPAT